MSSNERIDEIERTEERKTSEYKSEIDLLEKKLRDFENKYEGLQADWQSNLKRLAIKKVDLVVAKEVRAFSEGLLDQKRAVLIEERRKLDDLHWQVWDEERKVCNEISKCLADNNSVNFLNEYPLVLKSGKYAFTAAKESDEELRKAIEESPEIKKLSTEIAELETEIKKVEVGCWQETLERVLAELEKFKRLYPANNSNETKRLIEALECSHRERMLLEAEISKIESTTETDGNFGKEQMEVECEEPENTSSGIKIEKKEAFNFSLSDDKKWLEHTRDLELFNDVITKADEKQNTKLKAKEWYEKYTCELAVSERENKIKNYYTGSFSQCDILKVSKPETAVELSASAKKCCDSKPQQKKKIHFEAKGRCTKVIGTEKQIMCSPKSKGKTTSESRHTVLSTSSRFFEKEKNNPKLSPGITFPLVSPRPKRHLDPANESGDSRVGLLQRLSKPKRKFESLMATPSTFLKSAAETTVDNNSVQSNYTRADVASYASAHGKTKTTEKRTGKFTLKTPSNIPNCLMYRQTKLDDFHEFMLSDINH